MKEFFRGWRRKTGCVTLMIALGLFVGRIRSETYSDSLFIPLGTQTHCTIDSDNGYLFFETAAGSYGPDWRTLYCCDPNQCYLYFRDESVGWRFLYFAVGTHDVVPAAVEGPDVMQSMPRRTWFMSYWTAITPVTLLAAYLILWQSCRRAMPSDN